MRDKWQNEGQPSNKRIKEVIDGGRSYNNDCIGARIYRTLQEAKRSCIKNIHSRTSLSSFLTK